MRKPITPEMLRAAQARTAAMRAELAAVQARCEALAIETAAVVASAQRDVDAITSRASSLKAEVRRVEREADRRDRALDRGTARDD